MRNSITSSVEKKRTLKGYHVLVWMLGFFAVMFAANGIFLYNAIKTFPGEEVEQSYVQGLAYNTQLAKNAKQAQLGWTVQIGREGDDIVLRLLDANGVGLDGYSIAGTLRRAGQKSDISVEFVHEGNSVYRTKTTSLLQGRWDLEFDVFEEEGGSSVFEGHKVLLVA